jgi:hypothetical protein
MRDGLSFSKSLNTISLKLAAVCSLLILPSMLFAQERGKVEVVKDPKVDSLIQGYLVDKKTGPLPNVPVGSNTAMISTEGFRVQIYSGVQRQAAYDAQAKFQERFPDQRTYISYSEPYFKVHVGDFRTRLEAEKMANDMKPWFSGLFIVSEKITPKLNTE